MYTLHKFPADAIYSTAQWRGSNNTALVMQQGDPPLLHCTSNFPLHLTCVRQGKKRGCGYITWAIWMHIRGSALGLRRLLSRSGVKVCLFIPQSWTHAAVHIAWLRWHSRVGVSFTACCRHLFLADPDLWPLRSHAGFICRINDTASLLFMALRTVCFPHGFLDWFATVGPNWCLNLSSCR